MLSRPYVVTVVGKVNEPAGRPAQQREERHPEEVAGSHVAVDLDRPNVESRGELTPTAVERAGSRRRGEDNARRDRGPHVDRRRRGGARRPSCVRPRVDVAATALRRPEAAACYFPRDVFF
ncbi:MAG: hypothetical protein ACRDNC_08455 [Gaiellaceae bacterium]